MDDRGARSVQERAPLQIGGRARGEERTSNMPRMFVTLEVSKLNGWLNADAYCRESKEGHAVRGELWFSRRATAAHAACKGGLEPPGHGRA